MRRDRETGKSGHNHRKVPGDVWRAGQIWACGDGSVAWRRCSAQLEQQEQRSGRFQHGAGLSSEGQEVRDSDPQKTGCGSEDI